MGSSLRRVVTIASIAAVALAAAHARAEDAVKGSALEGTWKRTQKGKGVAPADPLYVELAWDAASSSLKGRVVNPPAGGNPAFKIDVAMKLDGSKLDGVATWHEGQWNVDAQWKLDVKSDSRLEGQCEWMEWEEGKDYKHGFDDYQHGFDEDVFERLDRDGVGSGPAPEKVASQQPVDAAALAGTWRNPVSGTFWCFKPVDGGFVTTSPDGKIVNEDVKVTIKDGLVVGTQTPKDKDGKEGAPRPFFELALTPDGKLAGRAAWYDADAPKGMDPLHGWAGLARERLPRIDAPPAGLVAAAPKPFADAPPPLGNLRRQDGLYVTLTPREGGLEGELRTKDGEVKATVKLAPAGNLWEGTATFPTADGGKAELKWQIGAPDEKGALGGALECGDYDAASKTVVHKDRVEGWQFLKLRRVE